MLGPEYWSALNHTTYFKLYGKTPEQIWFTLRRALEEGEDGDWEVPWKPGEEIDLPYLDLEHMWLGALRFMHAARRPGHAGAAGAVWWRGRRPRPGCRCIRCVNPKYRAVCPKCAH